MELSGGLVTGAKKGRHWQWSQLRIEGFRIEGSFLSVLNSLKYMNFFVFGGAGV